MIRLHIRRHSRMLKLWFVILLSIDLILVATSIFISDGVEIFRFTKSKNASDEFDFEWVVQRSYSKCLFSNDLKKNAQFSHRYRVENNEIFRGQTYQLVEGIRFMFGKDSNVFWVKLTRNDLEKAKTKPLLHLVRLGESFSPCLWSCGFRFTEFEAIIIRTYFFCSARCARRRYSNIPRQF